jgi:hypothetical protein
MKLDFLLISIFFIIIGIIIMKRNKFYKITIRSMLLPAELKLFLSGLILFIIGFIILFSEFLNNF